MWSLDEDGDKDTQLADGIWIAPDPDGSFVLDIPVPAGVEDVLLEADVAPQYGSCFIVGMSMEVVATGLSGGIVHLAADPPSVYTCM